MSAPRQNSIIAAAVVLGAIGLSLSAYTFREIGDAEKIHRSRAATLRDLESLRERAAKDSAGFSLMTTMATNAPCDLSAAAEKVLPGSKPLVEQQKTERLTGGWSLKQSLVTFEHAALSDTGRYVEYVENQRPPWRLSACEFTAASPGRGHVKLTFETVAR